jgi:hypothetical protein
MSRFAKRAILGTDYVDIERLYPPAAAQLHFKDINRGGIRYKESMDV